MSRLFILCLKFGWFQMVYLYNIRCPEALETNMLSRAEKCNVNNPFHCLLLEGRINTYTHICRPWEWVELGKYPILDGKFIGYSDCSRNTYQPLAHKSYESNACQYFKSKCSEEGQLPSDSLSTTLDRSCYCDFNNDYVPIQMETPCIPSVHDCTCVKKICPAGEKLNSDYVCEKHGTEGNNARNNDKNSINKPQIVEKMKHLETVKLESRRQKVVIPCVIIGAVIIIYCVVFISVLMYKLEDTTDKKGTELQHSLDKTDKIKDYTKVEVTNVSSSKETDDSKEGLTVRLLDTSYSKRPGDTVTFTPIIETLKPTKSTEWRKRSQNTIVKVSESLTDRHKIEINKDTHSLTINKVSFSDDGTYIFTVTTTEGRSECTGTLDVITGDESVEKSNRKDNT